MTWTILHQYPSNDVKEHWCKFLTAADFPTHYVSPEYFLEPFFRDKDPFAILAWHEGKIVGVLTGLHDGHEVICGQSCRPQACFDKATDPTIAAELLIAGLREEARSAFLITLYTYSPIDRFLAHAYHCEKNEGVVMLDLTNGPDFLRQQFSDNRRRGIKAAIKAGVEVGAATTFQEFQAYHKIYVNWCARKNLVPTSFDILEKAFRLTSNRRLFLAYFDGEVIAGVVVRHCPKGIIEYAANSSLLEKLHLKPNDLLHWRVIQWACREGYTSYSLGGTHQFLRKMGGTIVPVYRYRLDHTWFRRHERRETLQKSGMKIFRRMPQRLQNQVKQALRHGQ
jgi:hypothetical protein